MAMIVDCVYVDAFFASVGQQANLALAVPGQSDVIFPFTPVANEKTVHNLVRCYGMNVRRFLKADSVKLSYWRGGHCGRIA